MLFELPAVFCTGAVIYGCIELLSRGWTHWTMLLAGGICACCMYTIANRTNFYYWQKLILSAMLITTVEFVCGVVVNLILRWQVWDYTTQPMNLLGQICPLYSLIWLSLSVPGFWVCKLLQKLLR